MKRRLFNLAAAVSLVLFMTLACVALAGRQRIVWWHATRNVYLSTQPNGTFWIKWDIRRRLSDLESASAGIIFNSTVLGGRYYVQEEIESISSSVGRTYRTTAQAFIPAWQLLLLLSVLPATWIVRWRRRRRTPPAACPTCGYDLRATPQRCPECGAVPNGNAKTAK